ncbi:hypothetical protein IJ21_26390 [Paenibacillus sp. 32O-W]|jgi:hypothetical protein|uniref:Uncharacterized protein n=1 Tax=Paenibacillus cisolokensis TaxID=1658519 RepID=A0ABQ4NF08_9BACL|nr:MULTISPECIES: hypothetical protein [Paenibacillus]ALS28035.1 hypothetical protein IJ21_26390 [Paenibacillus sp. 32O-W]GIQ66823.1 hypothetical protein PACILC2_53910 [Paenibacillus cisolokensis]
MPFVCRHRESGVIVAAWQRNVYDLPYYGVLWWETGEDAERESEARLSECGYDDISSWETVEVTESRVKLMNVKLNNNDARTVVLERDGSIQVSFERP